MDIKLGWRDYAEWLGQKALPALHQTQFGGAQDALWMGVLGAGALACSPLAGVMGANMLVPGVLGMAGGALGARRIGQELVSPSFMRSALGIRSATPPVCVGGQGLLIGYTCDGGQAIRIPYEHLMRHFLTGGMTGVGKTVSATTFMVQQIAAGGGLLWVDGKLDPDNILLLYHLSKWLGREVDFRVINPGNPKQSNTYNPLLFGSADEVASRILSTIPSTEGNAGADYYKQAANQGLTTLIAAIKATGLAYNAMDLSILLTNAKALQDLETKCEQRAPSHPATRGFKLFLEQFKTQNPQTKAIMLDMKKLKDTFGGVAGRLFVYGSDEMGEITSTYNPDVQLARDIKMNRIIYCALPTMGKQQAAQNFGKLVLGDFRSAIAEVQLLPKPDRPDPPFLCWFDEVASYGSASAMETPFQQARSAQIYIGVGYQENSSIEALGPSFLGTIVGNTYTKIFFKPGNRETADSWAELIGKHKKLSEVWSRSYGSGSSAARLRVGLDSQVSNSEALQHRTQEEEDFRVGAENLAKLDFGEAVVLYGGSRAYNIRVPKLDFGANARAELGGLSIQRPRSSLKTHAGLNLVSDGSLITKLTPAPADGAAGGKKSRFDDIKTTHE